jgi:hypothetical protein
MIYTEITHDMLFPARETRTGTWYEIGVELGDETCGILSFESLDDAIKTYRKLIGHEINVCGTKVMANQNNLFIDYWEEDASGLGYPVEEYTVKDVRKSTERYKG